jgi:hypothetical protein
LAQAIAVLGSYGDVSPHVLHAVADSPEASLAVSGWLLIPETPRLVGDEPHTDRIAGEDDPAVHPELGNLQAVRIVVRIQDDESHVVPFLDREIVRHVDVYSARSNPSLDLHVDRLGFRGRLRSGGLGVIRATCEHGYQNDRDKHN